MNILVQPIIPNFIISTKSLTEKWSEQVNKTNRNGYSELSLRIDGDLNEAQAKELSNFLKTKEISVFEFTGTMTDSAFNCFISGLENNSTLQELGLPGRFINFDQISLLNDNKIKMLLSVIHSITSLHALNLSNNSLSLEAITSLAQFIETNNTLHSLDLANCFQNDGEGSLAIAHALKINTTLTYFRCEGGFSNEAFEHMEECNREIKSNVNLTANKALTLHGLTQRKLGLQVKLAEFINSQGVLCLHSTGAEGALKEGIIDAEVATAIVTLLPQAVELTFADCRLIGEEAAKRLAKGLIGNTSVKNLDLRGLRLRVRSLEGQIMLSAIKEKAGLYVLSEDRFHGDFLYARYR